MKKILFIYGYGGSPDSKFCTLIRDALNSEYPGEYEVLCEKYPQDDCAKAHEVLLKCIKEHDIDLIIGTSLGGFIALTLDTNVSTIVLNPCMIPSVELPKLKPRKDHPDDKEPTPEMIATYKPFEPDAFNKEAYKRRWIMGMFAENDELLGTKYKNRFIDCYDIVRSMPGGHHGNPLAIPYIVKEIESYFSPGITQVRDWHEVLCDARDYIESGKTCEQFCWRYQSTNWCWLWKGMKASPCGEVVIRLIEGGNRVMKVGDSKCGYTPGLVKRAPIVIDYPNGKYTGGYIESIDWENETFKTAQSSYSFHFVKK